MEAVMIIYLEAHKPVYIVLVEVQAAAVNDRNTVQMDTSKFIF